MKVVAKFLGKVNKLNQPPAISYVTLKNVDTGESVDTDAVSEMLLNAGIDHVDCEFEILVTEEDGKNASVINKLEPRKVAEKEPKSISEESRPQPPADAEKERIKQLEAKIKELESMLLNHNLNLCK